MPHRPVSFSVLEKATGYKCTHSHPSFPSSDKCSSQCGAGPVTMTGQKFHQDNKAEY